MISQPYKCIFIEVPKTGSTSIRTIIGEPLKAHMDIREYKEKITTQFPFDRGEYNLEKMLYNTFVPASIKEKRGEKIFNEYFKFGFVRNPWSRAVSLYLRKESIQMRDKMTFEEFVNWINYSSDTCVHPSQKRNQLDWFLDEKGEVAVDFIGKFENLESDWQTIAEKIHADPVLPHANRNSISKEKHYSEYYTDKTKEIIRKKFIVDVEKFGYDFI